MMKQYTYGMLKALMESDDINGAITYAIKGNWEGNTTFNINCYINNPDTLNSICNDDLIVKNDPDNTINNSYLCESIINESTQTILINKKSS